MTADVAVAITVSVLIAFPAGILFEKTARTRRDLASTRKLGGALQKRFWASIPILVVVVFFLVTLLIGGFRALNGGPAQEPLPPGPTLPGGRR
jgi:hypothetical protein